MADFLTRAREAGYAVPPSAMDRALDRLRNVVANAAASREGGDALPLGYAAYVLARNGRPVMGDLRYLAGTRLDALATPLAKAQLGAALAMLGDRARAAPVFAAATDALAAEADGREYREDYGSKLRDAAAVLASGTLVLAGDDRPLLPAELVLPSPTEAVVTIVEGRYHQVRRMFAALGNRVVALHRDRVGGFALPDDLPPGAHRILAPGEVAALLDGPAGPAR